MVPADSRLSVLRAVMTGDLSSISAAIESGADINELAASGSSALVAAVARRPRTS
jgi:hypothetical protein